MTQDAEAAARIAELEADNRRLRRLLDQRDAPGELRHRLRSTLAILRAIIRESAMTNRDLDEYAAHLEDRLDALVRAQAAADEHGAVELHTLIADELFHYRESEGGRVLLSGPDLDLPPRTGQVFALAIHELTVNAVEHGAIGTATGRIEVAWTVSEEESDRVVTLCWKESGMKEMIEPSRTGFGSKILFQMLRYELKADTSLVFEPDGLRCTISFPVPEPSRTTAT